MLVMTGASISELYTATCVALTKAPKVTARGLETKEIIGLSLELTDPRARIITNVGRAIDMRYCIGELCYFLAGRTDLASIYHYSKFWAKVSDDGKTVNSAYGHRLFTIKNNHAYTQLDYIVDVLIDDPSSRKAVMPIYDRHDAHDSKDNPCTMFLQFFIRNNCLQCHTFMRSNDAWLGLPYDVACFTLVQEIVYTKLIRRISNLELGSYFHNVTSFHAYAKDWEGIAACAKEKDLAECIVPALTFVDTDSWFNDLLTFEKASRGVVLYKQMGPTTLFQTWAKQQLTNKV